MNKNVIIFCAMRKDNSELITGTSIIVFIDNGELKAYMPEGESKCVAMHDNNGNIDSVIGKMYQIDYESLELYSGELTEETENVGTLLS